LQLALDISDASQSRTAVMEAVNKFGRIDILANNAGFGNFGYFEALTPEKIEV
jgi:NAD(P)-dependent dehydrogenase (short-subunit alcohol dehydrogenase family)